MTKRTKTPTLAELRRLAKRKGPYFSVETMDEWGVRTRLQVWDSLNLVCEFRRPMTRAARMVFAALSALPDAPKGSR